MKVSISNFKSIARLDEYELKPLTLLAGINSSGKSSLIQSLLLLKQSIEGETKKVLKLDGPYLFANSLVDLIYMKRKSNIFGISFLFDNDDFDINGAFSFLDRKKSKGHIERCGIALSFSANGTIHLKDLKAFWETTSDEQLAFSVKLKSVSSDTFDIGFSSSGMISGMPDDQNIRKVSKCKLEFRDFIPFYASSSVGKDTVVLMLTAMKEFHTVLSTMFGKMVYIGPLRVKPELAKSYNSTSFANVGIDGDNTRFILNQNKEKIISGYGEDTLLDLCRKWICKRMDLAEDIDVVRDSDKLYRLYVTNKEGIKVDLMHMGFGLSQILPVIVQGLLVPEGGTLIVEDPDVHMHPSVQALVMDFLLDLAAHKRNVLVETHSDHMVTRLRRRISESEDDKLLQNVNITFVEENGEGSVYNKIQVTDTGAFSASLPHGFLDSQDEDFRAILMARSTKSNKRNGQMG